MTIEEADDLIVRPTLEWMGELYESNEARVMLLAIGWQETKFRVRVQDGRGPARSFWQFEFGKKAAGYAFCTARSAAPFRAMATRLHYLGVTDPSSVKAQLGGGADKLACIMARWLLWQDKRPLPMLGSSSDAWDYYYDNWKPGKPRPQDWSGKKGSYALAMSVLE